MNGPLGNLDELLAQVRRRAEQRALIVERGVAAEVARIDGDAATAAHEAVAAIEADAERAALVAQRSRRAEAAALARRRRLEAREARLERVFAAAGREVALDRPAPGALAILARRAAARLGGEEVVIEVDAATHATLTPDVVHAWSDPAGPALRLADEPGANGSGVRARAGRRSVDATFEGRLAQARDSLREEVAVILAGLDAAESLTTPEAPAP